MDKIVRWIPALLWMGVIFYLSHQSGDELGSWLPFFQEVMPWMISFDWGHFLAYFILALTYFFALSPSTWRGKLLVILYCFLYGITDEIHQAFVPNRMPDWLDLRNDAIGAALAMIFMSLPPIKVWYEQKFAKKY